MLEIKGSSLWKQKLKRIDVKSDHIEKNQNVTTSFTQKFNEGKAQQEKSSDAQLGVLLSRCNNNSCV